jgi:hypothetical protein
LPRTARSAARNGQLIVCTRCPRLRGSSSCKFTVSIAVSWPVEALCAWRSTWCSPCMPRACSQTRRTNLRNDVRRVVPQSHCRESTPIYSPSHDTCLSDAPCRRRWVCECARSFLETCLAQSSQAKGNESERVSAKWVPVLVCVSLQCPSLPPGQSAVHICSSVVCRATLPMSLTFAGLCCSCSLHVRASNFSHVIVIRLQ